MMTKVGRGMRSEKCVSLEEAQEKQVLSGKCRSQNIYLYIILVSKARTQSGQFL